MIFYFSATGNCQHIAKSLAEKTGEQAVSITASMRQGLYDFAISDQERIGFVTPVYFWGLPSVVVDFLKRLHLSANADAYCYHVLAYGTTAGQAQRMLAEHLARQGITLQGRFIVKTIDTWTPVFNLTNNEKNHTTLARMERDIQTVGDQVIARTQGDFNNRKIPRILVKPYYATYPHQSRTSHFRVEDTCIGCGLCKRQCPVSAITMQGTKPTWTKPSCALCLGCLHRCPKFSIQYGRHTKKHGQYVNPYVKLP